MSELIDSRFLSPRALSVSALCLALVATGCEKKVVRTSTPPVLVPSIESSPQPVPQPQPQPAASIPTPPPATPEPDVEKPKTKPHKTIVRTPAPKPAEQPKPEPAKPEIAKPAEEPKTDVQITAAVPQSTTQSQTQTAEQLLRKSEGKLNGISRALNESEQSMAKQARNYIAQSRQAIQEGEVERAYNLAVKANLLAEELAK